MKVDLLVKKMIDKSGKSPSEVSKQMGRTRNYIYAFYNKKPDPKLSTFIDIAQSCGYSIVLKGHDEEIDLTTEKF